MDRPPQFRILDENGQPVSPRIESALVSLVRRLQRDFSIFCDDGVLIETLEEAGRSIAQREAQLGPVERLHSYAWVTLRNLANSRMRGGPGRIVQQTLASEEAQALLVATPARRGTAEEIERRVLLREVLEALTKEERLICLWKKKGLSSREIAARRGGSAAAVDALLTRIRRKVRTLTEPAASAPRATTTNQTTDAPRHDRRSGGHDDEHSDGTPRRRAS
jgi:RNA polymerase sigma factor (sigma-70 family)